MPRPGGVCNARGRCRAGARDQAGLAARGNATARGATGAMWKPRSQTARPKNTVVSHAFAAAWMLQAFQSPTRLRYKACCRVAP